ncbi:hypothetical protein SRABI123_04179 [Pseudomonas sp. Bi123]|nr:hypothetical protein SRABI123_04179 [Pseudomonas sp. Bi123]
MELMSLFPGRMALYRIFSNGVDLWVLPPTRLTVASSVFTAFGLSSPLGIVVKCGSFSVPG